MRSGGSSRNVAATGAVATAGAPLQMTRLSASAPRARAPSRFQGPPNPLSLLIFHLNFLYNVYYYFILRERGPGPGRCLCKCNSTRGRGAEGGRHQHAHIHTDTPGMRDLLK